MLVNDIHSRLNPTTIAGVARPQSADQLADVIRRARAQGSPLSIAGARHAMGGQQFLDGATLLDMRGLDAIMRIDDERGLVECEAGIAWPALIDGLNRHAANGGKDWSIVQKQTGADDLTLGGALAANVHGRGLTMRPIVSDVEALTLIDAGGVARPCSRTVNQELFRLAIGGYGLFGAIATVTLRLQPRFKVRRDVDLIDIDRLMAAFDARIAAGYRYGDFQFSTDAASEAFLRRGVFACYKPVEATTPLCEAHRLDRGKWLDLLTLAHCDRAAAYRRYADHYLATSGQVYWSDRHQLSAYVPDFHALIERRIGAAGPAGLMIGEIYVPRPRLGGFMDRVRHDFRRDGVPLIYGTIRLIEADRETFLPWARRDFACVIFNLRVEHNAASIASAKLWFRRLIDHGLEDGGSFYLTYHRWARADQIERAYPEIRRFLAAKAANDPAGIFASDWHGALCDTLAVRAAPRAA